MKTLVYCTGFAPIPWSWDARYRTWLDAIQASELHWDQLLIVDDGSQTLPSWPDVQIVREADAPTPRDLVSDAPAVLYHFDQNLGRPDLLDFPGWHRSFAFGPLYAQAHGFEKVIHLESDAFLTSPRLQRHFNSLPDGWMALWSDKYEMPELAIQAAAGPGLRAMVEFVQRPYSEMIGKEHEKVTPFTVVERTFVGDRFGEHLHEVPRGIDYATQVESGRERSYYWWTGRGGKRPLRRPAPAKAPERIYTLPADGLEYGDGWSHPENGYRWATDFSSVLTLPPLAGDDMVLEFTAGPLIHTPVRTEQRLLTLVNDLLISDVVLRREARLRCVLPPGLTNPAGLNRVRFLHPDGVAPSSIADIDDNRRLSLTFSDIAITAGKGRRAAGGWPLRLKPKKQG